MIFIRRNDEGNIIEIDFAPAPNLEEISLFDPELKNFLQNSPHSEELIKTVLDNLDLNMVRVIEDLIDVLIDKDLIRFTDLPSAVQNKLLFKKSIRSSLQEDKDLLIEEEEPLNF
ncbi:hypothetical protein QCB45_07795 [Thiomicrorhabdus sp. ZW0627]|uniref:hypothetical protein n=1 Tax=Thiomicrorhabdus sp. ZW0627 TaxID=3039774 RepID=UPI002436D77F|nr:hypothetical protein [Thiomicrorhabdus sp. ZW0627]MDG6774232.1 hypothetical protein [Thiomicrorhabdus sp. ZW0627]